MLKLSVASHNLLVRPSQMVDANNFLISSAQCLLQQVIYAQKKSFEADKYAAVESWFCINQEGISTKDKINEMVLSLSSSDHHKFTTLMDSLIEPLLTELYLQRSSKDCGYSLGCSWLRVGALRYHLLICCDDLDPTVKYSIRYMLLEEKIASLELEKKESYLILSSKMVCKECEYLAGCFLLRDATQQKTTLLEKLREEKRMLQRLIVFRMDPGKFVN